jgi:peptidoglycan/xylan/chitin deacetylase (PgdA/CDA1 family)
VQRSAGLTVTRKLKRGLRSAADRAARLSGILARRERRQAVDLTVLTYHRVLPDEHCAQYPFPSLAMPESVFAEQVRWLAANVEVLPLVEALEQLHRERNRAPRTRPLLALTFDDGYRDSSEIAAGVLGTAGLRATFFVTTGFVGTEKLLWFDRAALLIAALPESSRREVHAQVCGPSAPGELPAPGSDGAAWVRAFKRCRPAQRRSLLEALESSAGGAPPSDGFQAMSVAELLGLQRSGHEIGSHTVSHELLSQLDDAELELELRGAQQALAGWMGSGVPGFCYPNGTHDARVSAAVARAGHAYACTTEQGTFRTGSDPMRVPRVDVVTDRVTDSCGRFDATAFRRELCNLYRRA